MSSKQINTPAIFREKIRSKLILKFGNELTPTIIANIEIGVYNYAVKEATNLKVIKKWDIPAFSTIYMDRLRTIWNNLKNVELLASLKSEELSPKTLAFMTHQEMCPDKWKQLIEDKKVRDKQKYEPNIEASTDNFTCNKCKSKKCTYYQLQTRSADEPMTTFVSCLDCGKRWKC
jgi:transcription elongation factor S-II